jgi:dienelactone hydrolase
MIWDNTIFEEIPETFECTHLKAEGLTPLFYSNVPYKGKPTRVFAWLGLPKGASKENPAPAIVLIHGGGGTAFEEWVRHWNNLGYAAISMDTCGAMPPPDCISRSDPSWPRHSHSGPGGWGGWNQMDDAPRDHWTYHAVNAIARGHSLLQSLPEVDGTRIGVTGVSWGGVLTCLSASLDKRYKCASPIYGCGFIEEESGLEWTKIFKNMAPDNRQFWKENWDPAAYLSQLSCPTLWTNGTNDFTFFPSSWQKSIDATKGEKYQNLKVRLPHNHLPDGESQKETVVFMDSFLQNKPAYPKIKECIISKEHATAIVSANTKILDAQLVITFDNSYWPDRQWHIISTKWDKATATAKADIPKGTTAAYIQFLDEREVYISTPITFFTCLSG